MAAVKRALQRERNELPLFADQVATEQPTAEQRISDRDALGVRAEQGIRDLEASHWRWARRQLETISSELRERDRGRLEPKFRTGKRHVLLLFCSHSPAQGGRRL